MNTLEHNISCKPFSSSQISLLSKGVKFVPTRKLIDKGKFNTDLKSWERRMRLREYFYTNDEEEIPTDYNRKEESTWTPAAGREKWLYAYLKSVNI